VTQDEGPEFKPQYCKKKEKKVNRHPAEGERFLGAGDSRLSSYLLGRLRLGGPGFEDSLDK
jgi:hypothetical protein